MDYKRAAVEELRSFAALLEAETNLAERIDALRLKSAAVRTSGLSAAPTHGGGSRHEDALLSAIVEIDRLKAELSATKHMIAVIRRGLDALSREERTVLEKFYINRPPRYVDDLCDELGCERSQVYRMKDQAVKNYIIAAYGAAGMLA